MIAPQIEDEFLRHLSPIPQINLTYYLHIYIFLLILVRETFRLNEGSGVEIGKLNLQSQPGLELPHR